MSEPTAESKSEPKQVYDPATIEPKWQRFWVERDVFRTPNPGDADFDAGKPKFYALDMFPYPSAAGLHVGHPEGYTATDIVSRYKRAKGFNVLHPMGWDAFGLPAEQYAIQTNTHPAKTTAANVETFRGQLQRLGFSYDWNREISTADPKYFRWTQWIWKRLYERGLAYESNAPVWWCEALGTVLANDEVINGRSERGDHPCERRPLRQWVLKITEYAERLLNDIDGLDWSESLKTMQREWIGKSEGAEVDFDVIGHADTKIRVFTTRPDTLFGASFMVLAPEHPLVDAITATAQRGAVDGYKKTAASKSELERTDLAKDKSGVWTGAYAQNPLYPEGDERGRIPVWIADYVIVTYGTGAIMAVPAGDERDFEFAQKFDLAIPGIFAPATGDAEADAKVAAGQACCTAEVPYAAHCHTADGSLQLAGLAMAEAKRKTIEWLVARGRGEAKVTYKMRDWLFSRQRYWGEPFPVLHTQDGVELVPDDQLPVELPHMDDFKPGGVPESPLIRAREWVETKDAKGRPAQREINTMPGAAGSSWYFLRFCDPHNEQQFCSKAASDYWLPVDLYVGGTEHAVGHLLYSRFWTKVLHDAGHVGVVEPFHKLYNQGMIQAFAYEDGRGGIVPMKDVKEIGDEAVHATTGESLKRIVTKMSKRYGNVVNPDEVVGEYGADTLRLYEMYMGPLADSKPWNPKDVPGLYRFLQRAWRLAVPEHAENGAIHAHLREDRDGDPALEKALHRTIHKVDGDIGRMAFNTAIAAMMIFVNDATKAIDKLSRGQLLRFAQLLQPFAPHLAEELWARLSGEGLLAYAAWPQVDPAMLVDDEVEIAVQVLGKVRGRVTVATGAAKDEVLAAARAAVAGHLEGKTVVKEIVVPGKLVNFVVR
ncbi:MAG: leucine--tRNA ligase [Planctomycetes bacterium]|nr:leucine--tRNA ligase [Planctomycetota bacterium]